MLTNERSGQHADSLRDRLADGKLVGVLGAGVSLAALGVEPRDIGTHPASWTGLIAAGVRRCRRNDVRLDDAWVRRKLADLRSGRLEELLNLADLVTRYLRRRGSQELGDWLHDTVGVLEAQVRSEEVVRALHDLRIPLLTTNYDAIIEKVTGRQPITWKQQTAVGRWRDGTIENVVFHLHGHYASPETVVLTPRSYDEVTGDEFVQSVLHDLATDRTLIFIGCGTGLADPNFQMLRGWMGRVLGAARYTHYRLSTRRELRRLSQSGEHPPHEGIVVSSYGNGHAELSPYLRSLRCPQENHS